MIPLILLRKLRPENVIILPWATQLVNHRTRIQPNTVPPPDLDLRLAPLKRTKVTWAPVFTASNSEIALTLGSVVLFNLYFITSHSKFLSEVGGI